MSNLPHFLQPVSSDRALDILTNSMWSTMMITGIFFMSFLFVFLSIKVGQSIGIESTETGPIEISFLFSFSGIRYLHNHVRHHLFETPLLPRRRFSSLSTSWLPEFLKRASFTARNSDIFSEENGLTNFAEKGRRNSSVFTDSHNSRRSSASYKSKRLSVPHIQAPRNVNTGSKQNLQPTAVSNPPNKTISRRNTLPNLSLSTELSVTNENTENIITETTECQVQLVETGENIKTAHLSISNEMRHTESTKEEAKISIETKLMPIIEEESLDELDDNESLFGDIQSDISDSISEDFETINEKRVEGATIQESSESVNIASQTPKLSQIGIESSSPKSSSFRSAYFNYLHESIFGYSTNTLRTNTTTPVSPPIDSFSAPPGFSKRSASHDLTNSTRNDGFSNVISDGFNNHQPLYARRRTETSKMLSAAAKSFLPSSTSSISTNLGDSDSLPNRSNTASPCLNDLQNTDDLFAPINWNFSSSEQSEALRRSWNAAEEDERIETVSKTSNDSISSTSRRKSTSFSSLFEGY